MINDAAFASSQLDFFAGLVTEMKGLVPMGPGAINFRCVTTGRGCRSFHLIIRSCFPREDCSSARRGQFSDREASRAGASFHVAVRGVD
jgi:hypothetical protein